MRRKKLLRLMLATLAATSLTCFGGGVVQADADFEAPENPSDNTITVNESSYTVNGVTTNYSGYFGEDYAHIYGGYSDEGDALRNILNFNGGSILAAVLYGGYSSNGNASNNEVHIGAGVNFSVYKDFSVYTVLAGFDYNAPQVYGGYALYGDANENIVDVKGGQLSAIFGGYTVYGDAKNNTINIEGGTISQDTYTSTDGTSFQYNNAIFGGLGTGEASGNVINIRGGTIDSNIVAGAGSTSVINNSINIWNNPDLSGASLYGSNWLNHSGNTLNIYTKNLTAQNIYNFDAINFYLPADTVNNDTILSLTATSTNLLNTAIKAGIVDGNTSLTDGDTVYLIRNNGTITTEGTTYGTLSEGVSLEHNLTVEKLGDNAIVARIGNYTPNPIPDPPTPTPTPDDNTVITNAGSASNHVITITNQNYIVDGVTTNYSGESDVSYGGWADAGKEVAYSTPAITDKSVVGGQTSNSENAANNSITVNSGNITSDIVGGFSYDLEASDNVITVNGGTVRGIRGGDTYTGNVLRNTVIINDGEVGEIYGGMAFFAASDNVSVKENRVVVNGGNITGNVYGGGTYLGDASNNTVDIRGGTFGGNIYGGYGATANNNVVNIYGSPDLSNSFIYGGWLYGSADLAASFDTLTEGNTLNFYTKNIVAQNIGNFNALNFYIPADAVNGDTMLTLTDTAGTDLTGTAIKAGVQGGSALTTGNIVTLVTNANGLTTSDTTTYGTLSEGVSLNYRLAVEKSGDTSVIARIEGVDNITPIVPIIDYNPPQDDGRTLSQTKLLSITPITTLKLADFMSDRLIDWLPPNDFDFDDDKDLPDAPKKETSGYEVFMNMSGGSMRTKTGDGSYFESLNKGFDVGFGRTLDYSSGRLVFAPIFERATGNYDTYLSDGMHGKGSTKYTAGGMIGRKNFNNGFYVEASARFGKTERDFRSYDMMQAGQPVFVHYDKTSSPIFAGHLRVGKQLRLNKNNLLDVYGIYSHAYQKGMDLNLSTGETYHMSSATSARTRLGYRLTTRTSRISRIYSGLAVQYEHTSNVVGMYKGHRTPSAGSSGVSGMIELGWLIKPNRNNPWMIDLNATGWVGHQQGVAATFKLQKSF